MKKLLSLLGAIGLVATSSATVVSCDNGGDKDTTNAGDFTTDLTKVKGEDTKALEEVIKGQFEGTDGIADAQILIFDTIDNANNAEDVMTAGKGDTTMPGNITKIKGDEKSVAFYAYSAPAKEGEFGTTVLKGTITNKPEEKTGIDVDTKATVKVGETTNVTINNFKDLKDVKVASDNKEIATVAIDDKGVITIKGVAKGDANITVSATDVDAVTIVASVTEDAPTTVDITLDNIEDLTVKAGGTIEVKITNVDALTEPTATGDNDDFATVALDAGTITIKGVAEGTVKVTVNATNATDKVTFDVAVTAAK
jgi:hypothetical protein